MIDHAKHAARELAVAVVGFLALTGLITFTCKVAAKLNAKANADVRASYAQERVAADLDAILQTMTYSRWDLEHEAKVAQIRRHATPAEIEHIMATLGCREEAYVGYDNEIHPDECRLPKPALPAPSLLGRAKPDCRTDTIRSLGQDETCAEVPTP